ncbi:lysis system i-spanin subunit Rz [Salmonella enterica]|uniref:lysis system i-spanin subunit Rz n=1 Tax=Salmonella enterica TaxID=28901 RepID=UPI003B218639
MNKTKGCLIANFATVPYFALKERVKTMQKQLEGAQAYIRTQCHGNAGKTSNQW